MRGREENDDDLNPSTEEKKEAKKRSGTVYRDLSGIYFLVVAVKYEPTPTAQRTESIINEEEKEEIPRRFLSLYSPFIYLLLLLCLLYTYMYKYIFLLACRGGS